MYFILGESVFAYHNGHRCAAARCLFYGRSSLPERFFLVVREYGIGYPHGFEHRKSNLALPYMLRFVFYSRFAAPPYEKYHRKGVNF